MNIFAGNNSKHILVTGAAGYIGAHVCFALRECYDFIGIDNYVNSTNENNKACIYCDITDEAALRVLFNTYNIYAVIHLAAHKSVEESLLNPKEYYRNNVEGTLTLLKVMEVHKCTKIIFSSTACVYKDNQVSPLTEASELGALNPYGKSKLLIEEQLRKYSSWNVIILRYFNPLGGLFKDVSKKEQKNIVPTILDCIASNKVFHINGCDYQTRDGTCIRDYVNVVDIATGHIKCLDVLDRCKYEVINLGSGTGVSVLELIAAFEDRLGAKIKKEFKERRTGDAAQYYADITKANRILNWEPSLVLQDSVRNILVNAKPSS